MRKCWQQVATGSLGFLIFLSLGAPAASPTTIETLMKEARDNPFDKHGDIGNKILKLDPKSGDAYAILAMPKYAAHDVDGWIELCQKAVALKFRDTFWKITAYNYLYHGYIEKKDWTQALKTCELCFKIEETAGVAHDLSILYRKAGNMELSQKYEPISEKISQRDRAEFQKTIKTIRQAEDPKTVDTVMQRINEGLRKDPKDPEALMMRAHCYRTKKLYAKELNDVDTMIAMYPQRGSLYHQRSEIYRLLGDKKKSAADELEAKKRGFDFEKLKQRIQALQDNAKKRRGTNGSGTVNPDDIHSKPD
ncbi:hypothetical protein BH10CYA1_BH10CYA1_24380 [soil metagenome]